MRIRSSALLVLVLVLEACEPGEAELLAEDEFAATVTLANDVPITGIAGERGSEKQYSIAVPEGASALSFDLSGGPGDADLYVRFGAAPTKDVWDHRPYKSTANETVTPPAVRAGTWFLMVRGYSAYSGVTLRAKYSAPASTPLSNGASLMLSADATAEQRFVLEVPPAAASLVFEISGGTGDADLYVRRDSAPNTSAWDFRPYRSDSNERVAPPAPFAGTWFVMVRAYKTYAGVKLTAGWSENGNTAFEDEVLRLVNERRAAGATCGGEARAAVPALAMNEQLRASARNHSADMAAQDYFAHDSKDGRTFDARIREAGYSGDYPWGENIAAGQATPAAVVEGWMLSPHHCENIMSGAYRAVGIGYAVTPGSAYRHYWTQDFGGG